MRFYFEGPLSLIFCFCALLVAFSTDVAFAGDVVETDNNKHKEGLDNRNHGYGDLLRGGYEIISGEEKTSCRIIERVLNSAFAEKKYLYSHDIFLRWNPVDFQSGRRGESDQAWSNNPDPNSRFPRSVPLIRYDWTALPVYNNAGLKLIFRLREIDPHKKHYYEHASDRTTLRTYFVIEDNWRPFSTIAPQYIQSYAPLTRRKWYSCFLSSPRSAEARDLCIIEISDACNNCQDDTSGEISRFFVGSNVEFEILKIFGRFLMFFRRDNFKTPLIIDGRQYVEIVNTVYFNDNNSFEEQCLLGVATKL